MIFFDRTDMLGMEAKLYTKAFLVFKDQACFFCRTRALLLNFWSFLFPAFLVLSEYLRSCKTLKFKQLKKKNNFFLWKMNINCLNAHSFNRLNLHSTTEALQVWGYTCQGLDFTTLCQWHIRYRTDLSFKTSFVGLKMRHSIEWIV